MIATSRKCLVCHEDITDGGAVKPSGSRWPMLHQHCSDDEDRAVEAAVVLANARAEEVMDAIVDRLLPDVLAFKEDSNRRLGASGPACRYCGQPMTLLVKGGQGKGDTYGCGPCGDIQ